MSDQYQPTAYYDWVNRTHGLHLVTGNYQLVPYDYYAGDELHIQNVVFRNSKYVTYDNTHVRFLNKSDIHVYDTSNLVIHDSGTLTMYTSSNPGARTFIVDEIGRVGIGMNHLGVHSNHPESPSFDLDVRGQVGIEDYIYHNDDTDTYMLFGTDTKAHHVNADGSITPSITPPNQDYDEVNFRVGGVDMLQMKEDDTQDELVVNKNQADVDTIIRTSTNTQAVVVSGDGSEVVINGAGNSDTNFRIESDKSEKILFVDSSTDMITLSGPGAGDDTAIFDIQGNDDDDLTGASLLYVDPTETVLNKDANDHNFRVVAQGLDPQQDTTDTGTDGNVQNHTAALASHALFVDATNGRVGIGHNNPSTTLHVAGSAHIEGDLWVKGVTNQIDTLIHATSAMDITNIGTGPALTVTQSGAQPVAVFWDRDNNDTLQASLYLDDMTRMGVGTSSPEYAVHISDTVESQAGSDLVTVMVDHNFNHGGIGINSTYKNHQNHVRFLSGGDETWQLRQPLQYTTDPDSLRFTHASRAFDVITMIPTGHVGIGRNRGSNTYDSAPQYRLQIAGDIDGSGSGDPSEDIVQITTNDNEISTGQEQGLTFGQGDASFSKIAGFYQGSGEYGLKLYSCLETSRPSETRGNFRYNDLAGITLLGDNKTGINFEAPTAQLHVYRGDQHETQSGLTVHRGDTSLGIRATAPILNVFNGNAGATEVFRVQGDGKTGIGTDDPDTALHVQRVFNTGTTTATRTALQPMLTLAATRGTGNAPHTSFGPTIDFKSVNYDTPQPYLPHPIARIAASITNAAAADTGGSLRFFTTPLDTATSNDDLVENMVIKPSGNIGMGTTSPDSYNGEADNLVLWSAGHTGLTIASLPDGDDQYRSNIYFADGETGNEQYRGGITYDHADDNMSFRTAATERMWIANNGNVGIGLDTPACSLDVSSTIRAISGAHTAPGTGSGIEMFATSTKGYIFNFDRDNSAYHDLQLGNSLYLPELTTPAKAGNVGINIDNPHTKLYIESTDGLRIPVGTTDQRPTNAAFDITAASPTNEQYVPKLGTIRYNTTQSTFEGFGPGNQWGSLGGVIDVDRDTYWTAINDLDNLHDLGGAKYGTDEFDLDTEYPGDVDYLRAFTVGKKRMAINPEGKADFYHFAGGAGSVADPYTYEAMVRIECTHTNMGTIYNPTITKDIRITTLNIGNNSNATAGNTLIESGMANNRIPSAQGSGGNAGKIKITSGDGADGYGGNSNGGNGGDIEISAGGGGGNAGSGITGANGAITLQSSAQVHVNNSGLSVTGNSNVDTPGAHLGHSSNYAYMELKGTSGSYIDFGPGAPNTGTTTWEDYICRIIQDGNDFSITNTQNHITLSANKDVVITKHDGTNGLTLGSTLVTATGAELNIMDGGTSAITTTLAAADRVVVNDAGTMKQVALTDFETFFESAIDTLNNLTAATSLASVGDLNSGNITSGFGSINTGTGSISGGTGGFSSLGVGRQPTATTGEINATGDIIAFSSSDERLKENVTPISDPIEKLSKIGGYEFDWKSNDECSHTGHDVGVIAQEIEQVLPDIVTTRDSGYKAVKYEKLTALLIEVTKSQQSQIDELKRQVEQLSK